MEAAWVTSGLFFVGGDPEIGLQQKKDDCRGGKNEKSADGHFLKDIQWGRKESIENLCAHESVETKQFDIGAFSG
jgi:hypothetical protein